MSYVPTVWSRETLLSARRLQHADRQYDEAKDYLDGHDHDTLYYTKTQAIARYYHLDEGDTVPAGLDADTVDGQHATDLIGDALPVGVVIAWPESDGDVPPGWKICNGQSDTPDMRGLFVISEGPGLARGATGGVASVTPAGTVTIASHAVTVAQMPNHRHPYSDLRPGGAALGVRCPEQNEDYFATGESEYTGLTTGSAGSGQAHGHPDSYISGSVALDNRPPYYALYFIKKVA